jgi:hypothetical protein
MKLIAALILLISANSFANPTVNNGIRNPMRRVCMSKGGNYWYPQRSDDNLNNLPLCRFGEELIGPAQIGAQTLVDTVNGLQTLAVEAYKASESNCSGRVVQAIDGDVTLNACEYADGSVIELETLNRGPADSRNAKLNQALGL